MKKIKQVALMLVVATSITMYSCGPTDDKNTMDPANSNGEGAIDTTRLTNSDTTSASVSVPHFIKHSQRS